MSNPSLGRLRAAALAALLAASAVGCGQQGPLVLPPDARPVEPAQPTPGEPESQDDERE
jgi:predicted small lipoprotein YifL